MISSFRLTPIQPSGPFGERVARFGGRCFLTRGGYGSSEGDLLVTLPPVTGGRCVIVPKGMGNAVVARPVVGGWLAEGSGSALSPTRWSCVGGLAAWVRGVRLPVGPMGAFPARERPVGEGGAWMAIRPVGVMWAEARRADPSAGRGAVVVADRWVRAVSPSARACGISVGMSCAKARSLCPTVRFVSPPPRGDAWERIAEVLSAEFSEVFRTGAGFLVRAGSVRGGSALALGERIALRLWQSVGVESRIAVAASAAEARALAAVLDPSQVAVSPTGVAEVWGGRCAGASISRSTRSGNWRGPAVPDVEGVVTLCRSLAPSSASGLSITLDSEHGLVRLSVPAGPLSAGARVESCVRENALSIGRIHGVRLRVTGNKAVVGVRERRHLQLPLLPAAR